MREYPVRAYSYVRFSSRKQRTGSSVERQVAWAKKLCEQRGISLDDTLSIGDAGVSAFRGKNRKQGGLFLFLQACKQGRVQRGSYLLVESLDRLSREHPLGGFELVKELLSDHGIVILTAFPEQEYSLANYDRTCWLMQAEFNRAYSESLAKSERSKFNWVKRRERSAEHAVGTRLPAWLKVEGDKLVADGPKAAAVRRVFELAAKGFGQYSIAKKLNAAGVPPVGKAAAWHESYVYRLLTGRAVLGEFQPHRHEEGVGSVPAGEVIRDHYPRVITDALWAKCRLAARARKSQKGRVSAGVSNLFTSLVYEGGVPCQFRPHALGRSHLQPATRLSPGVLYAPFEKVLLWFLRAVEVREGGADEYATLTAHADRLAASVRKLQAQIDADPGMADMLPTLAKWKREQREAVEKMESVAVPARARHLHTRRLVEALASAEGEELETLRREVRQAVRQVVERIELTVVTHKRPLPKVEAARLNVELPDVLPRSTRVVLVNVRLTTGETHHLCYTTTGIRLTAGVHLHTADGTRVDRIDRGEAFPVDPPTGKAVKYAKLREECKRLAAEGKTPAEIAAATGLNRATVHTYVRDYRRPCRK
jgi:DNA invertase Pin-like site-specific DNA recombinase